MKETTVLHVLWGVFNNPNTPAKTKELVKARIVTAISNGESSKLAKKISKKLPSSVI